MSNALPRYSRRAVPAQRYLPGRAARPAGPEAAPARFDPARWRECEDLAYGVDLWNRGYFWEAHEAWEGPWRQAGRDTPVGCLLQALILLAAAALKHELGAHESARRLAARGVKKVPAGGPGDEIDLAAFAVEVERWVRGQTPKAPLLRLESRSLSD